VIPHSRQMKPIRRTVQPNPTIHPRVSVMQTMEILECGDIGISGRWDVEMLGCWDVGMLGCWDVGMTLTALREVGNQQRPDDSPDRRAHHCEVNGET
jgi:hypothetical protein